MELDREGYINMAIAGDPAKHDDGLGHLINDGAMCKTPEAEGIYETVSQLKNNVDIYGLYLSPKRFTAWMIAQKSIEADEEGVYSYGVNYWRDMY